MAGRADDVPTPSLRQSWRTVAVAGLLAAGFDIAFALVFYGSAFTLSGWTVALGAALHFFIALCAAFIYWGASRRLSVLTRRPLVSGAAFGVAMYVAMHFIVLPLSRVHFRLPSLHNVLGELFSHIVLFGMVIALGVARTAPRDAGRW